MSYTCANCAEQSHHSCNVKGSRSLTGAVSVEGNTCTSSTTLSSAENLCIPTVQVVVMTANMNCKHCRERVSKVVSKMNGGLLDYMVDLRNKEVTVRGMVSIRRKHHNKSIFTRIKRSFYAH